VYPHVQAPMMCLFSGLMWVKPIGGKVERQLAGYSLEQDGEGFNQQ